MPAAEFSPQYLSDWFFAVRQAVPPGGGVSLVGGAVRDALLHQQSRDLDFVLPGDALRLARQVANALGGAYYPLDSQRGTGRVILAPAGARPVTLDFSRERGGDLASDLAARDFTINAIAVSLDALDRLVDPLAGQADLKAHRLRACSERSILEDPLRILRAARLAETFDLSVERRTLRLIHAGLPHLNRVSAERLRDEIFRILESGQPGGGIGRLVAFGAAGACFPGLEGLAPRAGWARAARGLRNFRETVRLLTGGREPASPGAHLDGLDALRGAHGHRIAAHLAGELVPGRSRLGLLSLAALYRSVLIEGASAPAGTRAAGCETPVEEIGTRLVLSGPEIETWLKVCQACQGIGEMGEESRLPGEREIYRYFRAYGAAGLDGCLLALGSAGGGADTRREETSGEICGRLFDAWWNHPEQSVRPPILVDGWDLQAELGIRPGPQVGRLLEEIRESQVEGTVSTREQALQLARRWIARAE